MRGEELKTTVETTSKSFPNQESSSWKEKWAQEIIFERLLI